MFQSDIDLGQLYQELGSLDNVQAVAQLNVWTTDGIKKYAMIHVCLKEVEKPRDQTGGPPAGQVFWHRSSHY